MFITHPSSDVRYFRLLNLDAQQSADWPTRLQQLPVCLCAIQSQSMREKEPEIRLGPIIGHAKPRSDKTLETCRLLVITVSPQRGSGGDWRHSP